MSNNMTDAELYESSILRVPLLIPPELCIVSFAKYLNFYLGPRPLPSMNLDLRSRRRHGGCHGGEALTACPRATTAKSYGAFLAGQ